jgi:hypothetical protein
MGKYYFVKYATGTFKNVELIEVCDKKLTQTFLGETNYGDNDVFAEDRYSIIQN